MSAHGKDNGRDFHKKGMTVNIRVPYNLHGEDRAKFQQNSVESAIKTLKRRMMHEGVVKDVRKKEYFKSKGEIRRERREVAVRKQRIADMKKDW